MGVLRFTMSGVLGHFNVTARLHEIKVRMKGDGKYVTLIFDAEMSNVITWGVIHVSWCVGNCDSFVSLVIHGTSDLKLARKHEILSATSAWPNYGDQLSSLFRETESTQSPQETTKSFAEAWTNALNRRHDEGNSQVLHSKCWPFWSGWSRGQVPVLLTSGRFDTMRPSVVRVMQQEMQNAEWKMFLGDLYGFVWFWVPEATVYLFVETNVWMPDPPSIGLRGPLECFGTCADSIWILS